MMESHDSEHPVLPAFFVCHTAALRAVVTAATPCLLLQLPAPGWGSFHHPQQTPAGAHPNTPDCH